MTKETFEEAMENWGNEGTWCCPISFEAGAIWQQGISEDETLELIRFLAANEEFNGFSSMTKSTAKFFLNKFKNTL
jgi:hypothetical protein